jgi:hypothetical protein
MVRRIAVALVALLFVAGMAGAGDAKDASGTVKTVSAAGFVVTDAAGKDWAFDVDKDTVVLAKGATHKISALKADGKTPTIGDFLKEQQKVTVKYVEKDGKPIAREVRVR